MNQWDKKSIKIENSAFWRRTVRGVLRRLGKMTRGRRLKDESDLSIGIDIETVLVVSKDIREPKGQSQAKRQSIPRSKTRKRTSIAGYPNG